MNILGLGIDIVENDRIKKRMNEFANKILNEKELITYNNLYQKEKLEFLAGRFAIKEAIIKALNCASINMENITIQNNKDGSPKCKLNNKKKVLISISHEKNYSVGIAIYIK
jgi:holo-[acyl-carrier protein] synthase